MVCFKSLFFMAVKPATFRGHGGIRRMPDKSENLRQQKMSQQQPATNTNLVNIKLSEQLKKLPQNDSMEDINLDSSMSKSIQEALFYQPLKANTQTPTSATTTTTSSAISALTATKRQHNQVHNMDSQSTEPSNDSSILKLNSDMDSQISSSTCSNSMDDSSILHSVPAAGTKSSSPFIAPVSLNVDSPFKGISLKDFESHRKMIEEQNRQKKEMLYKVIEQQ